MASKIKVTVQEEAAPPDTEGATTVPDSPLLDLADSAVKKLIRSAKKRGYVTHEQINAVLPSDEANSEQIEDLLSMFSEMGVNVVENDEAESKEEGASEEPDEEPEGENELVPTQPKLPAKTESKATADRTDDPVRMYLREMGTVDLLSREGEIAIAKRIEAGREAMIAGLCESPLTFQAIIIWRDELNEGRILLRDIIDLEASHAGPDAKTALAPTVGPDGRPIVGMQPIVGMVPPSAPVGATPDGEAAPVGDSLGESDLDEDEMESSLSLAAIEAELKPKVLETFDNVAGSYKRLRRLAGAGHPVQACPPAASAYARAGAQIQEAERRDRRRGEVVAAQFGPHRIPGRAALRYQQAPGGLRRPADAARRKPWRRAR